jgi:hypothetical protein
MLVYVLLFNARTENEGIHTLRANDQDVVLMFENEDDATRFGLMLEAQDFPEATVEALEQAEVEEFCEGAGYGCKLVPKGALAVPPEHNVDRTDWDPKQPPDQRPKRSAAPAAEAADPEAGDLSQAELDRIRQQFEKLL